MKKIAVLFGGTGFIGRHIALHLIESEYVDEVVAADIQALNKDVCTPRMLELFSAGKWSFTSCDVRDPIVLQLNGEIALVFNLAAVHREPGHEPHEYYETNISGAENICAWAKEVGCNKIVFTSSIAPYGPSEQPKFETSIPTPVTPYGSSKLVAEKIHEIWQSEDKTNRRLVIVRPGVVFGPGEGGNVSRLIKAVVGRYFVFMGNRQVRKAGVYIKELCFSLTWVLDKQEEWGECLTLFNMTMNPPPSIEEYVGAVCKTRDLRQTTLTFPAFVIKYVSLLIHIPLRLLTGRDTFNPVRIRKLLKSNNIEAEFLERRGYVYQYSLNDAFQDWYTEMECEW